MGRALLILVAVIVAGGLGLVAWVSSEFTECYALYDSVEQAEATADDLDREPGVPGVDVETERRTGEVAATFSTGETGADARPLEETFADAVRANGGELGHPGTGCLSRGPIM